MTRARSNRLPGHGTTTALVDLALQYGGAETRVVQLLHALPDTFAVCVAGSGLHRRCALEGLPAVALATRRADPRLIGRLAWLLRRRHVSTVDAHGVAAQLWALPAAVLAGAPRRLATVHSEYRAEQAPGSLRATLYETVLRATRHTATGWIAVSGSVRDDLVRLGVTPSRVAIVRSGVTPDAPAMPADERARRRAALGCATDDLVIAVVGRLHPGKGHHVLVDALAAAPDDLGHARLLVIGDGGQRRALQEHAVRRGIAERVTFTGFRDDVRELLRLADLLCLPSDRAEGLPYALLEAAAAGLPIVASRLGGIADVFHDDRTAILVTPGDRDALTSALRRLTAEAERRRLGAAAHEMADAQLSTTVMAAATAALHGLDAPAVGGPSTTPGRRRRRAARSAISALSATASAGRAVDVLDRFARRSPATLPVLMYHRVAPVDDEHGFDPVLLSATPETFAEQIRRLTRTSQLLSLADVLEIRRGCRPLPERGVLLTFDDAYADFSRWAWPVLATNHAPCVLFVPTAYPGSPERQFWWEDLYRALQATTVPVLRTAAGTVVLDTPAARTDACRRLSAWVKATDHARAMAQVDRWLDELGRPHPVRTTVTWDELRALAAAGVDIAPHSRTHAMLDQLPATLLRDEIRGAIADIRWHLGACPPAFCYPAGQRSAAVRRELVDAGVELAFSTRHGSNRWTGIDWLDLQRIDVSVAMPPPLVQLSLQPWAEALAGRLA